MKAHRQPTQDQSNQSQGGPIQEPSANGSSERELQPRGNAEAQERLRNQQQIPEPACDEARLPAPVPADGSLGYYKDRHADFAERYQGSGQPAPRYYLEYGDKYINRFTFETHARLSPDGQAWLSRARTELQAAIENRRAVDPMAFDGLERDDPAFTTFAYASHADAYWKAGLGGLNVFDLANIALTPTAKDLLEWDGVTQAADIGARLGGVWGEGAIDTLYGKGTAADAMDGLLLGYEALGDEVDVVFGAGTSAILADTAIETGSDLVDLAESAHGVAEDVAARLVMAGDHWMGEGETEEGIDAIRRTASDVIDWVEERFNNARGWASAFAPGKR